MQHIDKIGERILFLGGDVIMAPSQEVVTIVDFDVKTMLDIATKMEVSTVALYNKWAIECTENSDSASKSLFEELVVAEEKHQDRFEIETDNFKTFGTNYLALQSIERSKNVEPPME